MDGYQGATGVWHTCLTTLPNDFIPSSVSGLPESCGDAQRSPSCTIWQYDVENSALRNKVADGNTV